MDVAEEKTMRFVKDGAVIAGSAALLSVVGEWAVQKTTWSEGARGGAQAVAGVAMGLVLAPRAPRLAMGALTYGFIAGVRGAAQEVQLRQFLAQNTTPQGAPGSATTSTGTSGQLYDGQGTVAGQYGRIYEMAGRQR
jgi:hypothetical protein